MKSHKKKSEKSRKSSKKSKKKSDSEESIELNQDIHPLRHYIDDRSELLNQVFTVIKNKQLKAMLPSVLKNISLDEIKSLCLQQLLGMSKQRILAILENRVLETSSSSESENEITKEEEDTLEIGISSKEMGDILKEKKEEDMSQPEEFQGKNLLEILELEMRARAIRALLKQQASQEEQKRNQEEKRLTIHLQNTNTKKIKLKRQIVRDKRKCCSASDTIHISINNNNNNNNNKTEDISKKRQREIQSKSKVIVMDEEVATDNNEEPASKKEKLQNVVKTNKVFGKMRKKIIDTSLSPSKKKG